MEKKRSVGVTVIGRIMFVYSILLIVYSICLILGLLGPYHYYRIKFLIEKCMSFPLIENFVFVFDWRFLFGIPIAFLFSGIIYLISSINILQLKNWAKILVVYFTSLIGLLVIVVVSWLFSVAFHDYRLCKEAFGCNLCDMFSEPYFLLARAIILFSLPCFVFLFFFSRHKVKEQFK